MYIWQNFLFVLVLLVTVYGKKIRDKKSKSKNNAESVTVETDTNGILKFDAEKNSFDVFDTSNINYKDELVPIKFTSPNKKPDFKTKIGIVFSWHGLEPDSSSNLYDSRFGVINTVGKGNEFNIAVRSCYEAHPEIPIYLFTNAQYLHPDTLSMLHAVYEVNLMVESGLDELYQATQDPKFGFGTKAYSVVTGWNMGVLPEWVLHFDVDITIVSVSQRWNLYTMFEPLQHYDVAGVMEGYSTSLNPETPDKILAVGSGWEMNTGAFAVKKSTKPLLEKWVAIFKQDPARFAEFQSGEQQAFMLALQEMKQYRLFALPPIFNFRRATLHARNGPPLPVMLHAHTFSEIRANASNYKEVAKHAAMLIFDDCYNLMKLRSGPYPFVCDMLVV